MKINNREISKEKHIEVIKSCLKLKLWRKEPEQKAKWDILVQKLSVLNGVEKPILIIDKNTQPCYNALTKTIILNKYSVISLLHEFAHHLGTRSEAEAVDFSEGIFLEAYKPAQRKLVRDERGFLVKRSLTCDDASRIEGNENLNTSAESNQNRIASADQNRNENLNNASRVNESDTSQSRDAERRTATNRNDNLNITDSTRRGGTEITDHGRNDNLNEDMRSDDITPTNDRNNRNNNLNTR